MVTLITGAGGGIGAHLAEEFANYGHDIVLVDINDAALKKTAGRIKELGVKCFSYLVDISGPEKVNRLRDDVVRDAGAVDILINNAAVFMGADFVDTPVEKWRWILGINLMGYVHMQHAFLPGMIKRGSGHIVNISSAAGLMGMPAMSAYCATKFAITGMTEALYNEMRGKKIKVSLVCPAFVNTPLLVNSPYIGYDDRYSKLMQRMGVDPKKTARRIARGVMKGKFLILTSFLGRLGYYSKRFSLRIFLISQAISYRKMQDWRMDTKR
jgi:short-subunit dehydrogenase